MSHHYEEACELAETKEDLNRAYEQLDLLQNVREHLARERDELKKLNEALELTVGVLTRSLNKARAELDVMRKARAFVTKYEANMRATWRDRAFLAELDEALP